jgi:uncharacterized DUF497 family protein
MSTDFDYHFEWDPAKALGNRRKHGVSFELAAEVFQDPLLLSMFDEEHSEHEERWVTLGQTSNGQLLVVIHTYQEIDERSAVVRIISARPAVKPERKQYENSR